MPPFTYTRKLMNDGRGHYRMSIPAVIAEFLGVAPEGGMVDITVDTDKGRLIITKAVE